MDINKFMRRLDRILGLSAMHLQKKFPLIMEILTDDTFEVFAQFIPMTYEFNLKLSNQIPEQTFGMENIYRLTDPFIESNNIEIISVEDVSGSSGFSDWNSQPATFNVEDIMLFGEMSSVRSQLGLSYKAFNFLGGNRIQLKGFNGYDDVKVIVKIPYQSIGAIPVSTAIEFEKLALLDIKMSLYPELKHYDKLDTADGTIDLKLDGWENAENDRNELIKDWRNKAIINQALGNKKIQQYE